MTNALVKDRGSSYVANPHAHAGRHAAQEVPAMVSGYEIRRRSENGSMIAPRFGVLSDSFFPGPASYVGLSYSLSGRFQP